MLGAAWLLVWQGPATAWGPKAQLTLIDFSLNLLTDQAAFPLRDRQREIREGVAAGEAELSERRPGFDDNLPRAIESEMQLLQRVGRTGFDLYYAYRLGMLGKLVAMASSPMQDAPAVYKNAYDNDIEVNIGNIIIDSAQRTQVDPRSYIPLMQSQASTWNELITKDYQEGNGFNGVARESLPQAASRTVNAISNVWYSLLTSDAVAATVSDTELRGYALGAMAYYIKRGNLAEIEAAQERMGKLVSFSLDMHVAIGDYFYEADFRERAMTEYRAALEQDPSRRDVVEKIGAYYASEGHRFLESGDLEKAIDAFDDALEADPANAAAQTGRMDTERLIETRRQLQERFAKALEDAANFEAQGEEHALRGYFVEGIAAFTQAIREYQDVTSEFPDLYNRAQQGMRVATGRVQEMRTKLMDNVAAFSGSGNIYDVRAIADMQGQLLDQEVLRSLVEQAYTETFDRLQRDKESLQRIE
jgi:tetratricopeptide (TPR) repeat protein